MVLPLPSLTVSSHLRKSGGFALCWSFTTLELERLQEMRTVLLFRHYGDLTVNLDEDEVDLILNSGLKTLDVSCLFSTKEGELVNARIPFVSTDFNSVSVKKLHESAKTVETILAIWAKVDAKYRDTTQDWWDL